MSVHAAMTAPAAAFAGAWGVRALDAVLALVVLLVVLILGHGAGAS